jgi:hypothetical protein
MSQAASFNATNVIEVTHATLFTSSGGSPGPWTISLWVSPSALSVRTFALARWPQTQHKGDFAIKVWSDGNVSFNAWYGGASWLWTWDTETAELSTNGATVGVNGWAHIAVTCS